MPASSRSVSTPTRGRSTLVMMASIVVLQLSNLASVRASEDDHAGEDAFEYAGLFRTGETIYSWIAQKGDDGAYADTTMKMAVLPVPPSVNAFNYDATLHGLEGEGNHALNATCTSVQAGGTINVAEDACVELEFDNTIFQSMFKIDTTGEDYIAIFTQHGPIEFETDSHFLRDDEGADVEAKASLPEEVVVTLAKPWGTALLACSLVLLCTLCGIIFMVPVIQGMQAKYEETFAAVTAAFAAGAILACAFYLILFESTHYVAVGWTDETQAAWRWGSMCMAGLITPWVTHMLLHIFMDEDEAKPNADVEMADVSKKPPTSAANSKGIPWRHICCGVSGTVLIGDFMHNFVDGVLIGTAFHLCDNSMGWGVAAATIGHEFAQELGDFCVLTGIAGLSWKQALSCNFASGLSVIFGCIGVLSQDMDSGAMGLILAYGGGTYVAIGASECLPRVFLYAKSTKIRLICLLAFVIGAVAIGLVLLDHKHCIPESTDDEDDAADPHAGHGH